MHGRAPRRGNSLVWIILGTVVGLCVLLVLGIGSAGIWAFGKVKPMAECTIEVQVLARSLKAYTSANGGKLPPAASWQTALKKELAAETRRFNKDAGPFAVRGPSEPVGCGKGAESTGFSFNTKYSGKKLSDLKMATEPLMFETLTQAVNANGAYRDIPSAQRPKLFGRPRPLFGVSPSLEGIQITPGGGVTVIGAGQFSKEDSPDP